MIHNNFIKLIRLFIAYGTSYTQTLFKDFTDIYGYTGTSNDTLPERLTTTLDGVGSNSSVTSLNNKSYNELINTSNAPLYSTFLWAAIGVHDNNELDYYIENPISSNISFTVNYIKNQSGFYSITTITNKTVNDISFDEIALLLFSYVSVNTVWNGSGSRKYTTFMLCKEVLSTPQTIPANSAINISFNLFGDTPTATVTPA